MNHPSDDELALYAFDPDSLAERHGIDSHVASCPRCSATLTFIRSVDAGCGDRDAWDIVDREESSTRTSILDLAAKLAAEDDEAEALLKDFITNPARTALANLASRRKFLTAGVVRLLVRSAADACDREPLDALTFADSAIEVAEHLLGYPEGVIHELRAFAYKERANALVALGQLDAALDALDHADREFSHAPGASLGHTIVQHCRAWVHFTRSEFDEAMKLLAESAEGYAAAGETERFMRARHLIANTLFWQGDVRGAQAIFRELLGWGEAENDLAWIARESNTLGRCAYELKDLSAAVQYFHQSIQAFRELGMDAEAIRPAWGFALVVLASGKPEEALRKLQDVREDFHRREMLTDSALVAVDMCDALHALGRNAEIVVLAAGTIETFTRAGMLTSAIAAFAYLKEAAEHGAVKPTVIDHVRKFMSRLEREPALLFHAPPEKI
jgi:tetratricopeptide (TPR) repeat protein